MMSDRKIRRLTWFARIVMLCMTFGSLYIVYVRTFVRPDIMESCGHAINALIGSTIFLITFPGLRIHISINRIKKQLSERSDLNRTLTAGTLMKNDVIPFIKLITILIITIAVIILNFVLAWIAYQTNNNLKLFLHIVVAITTVLVFDTFVLIYLIDDNFKELEKIVSQLRKNQTAEDKSE